jgi:hypothetical protein
MAWPWQGFDLLLCNNQPGETEMLIRIEMNGTSPLILHNDQLADPQNEIVRQIAAFTAKKKRQTDDDRAQVAKPEWIGGLYLNPSRQLVIPAKNVIKCLREAAAVTREGKQIARALSPTALFFQLEYEHGKLSLDELYKRPEYTFRALVKVGASRVSRVRPQFPRWSLISQFSLLEDVMNLENVATIAANAGLTTGLCDARILGYGRFGAKVTEMPLAAGKGSGRNKAQETELRM